MKDNKNEASTANVRCAIVYMIFVRCSIDTFHEGLKAAMHSKLAVSLFVCVYRV